MINFYMEMKNLSFQEAMDELSKKYGPVLTTPNSKPPGKIVAQYPYHNENGEIWFEVVRYGPKDFRQRVPDGKGGFEWGLKGREPVLYRLPELIHGHDPVFICEGEKDADRLAELGLTATTCPMGAGKWRGSFNSYLQDREVIILPDNDDIGRKHAGEIAGSLQGPASSLKIVELPGLPEHGDVSDYLESHGIDDFHKEIENTPEYAPPSLYDQLPSWNEMMRKEINVEWVVDGIIPANAITVFFGRGGIGKTWLIFDMARSVGNGIPFLGRKTEQRRVVIVDFENPVPVIKKRTEKLGEAENVKFWKEAPKLDSPEWEKYRDLPKGSLLIFDTLRASHFGDENASKDISPIMDRIKQLRDRGYTIILIHHTAKGAGHTSKGSTAIVDMADHALNLSTHEPVGTNGNNNNEPQKIDSETIYYFGWRDKTRYEPFESYLKLNPDRGFELAPDPADNLLRQLRDVLHEFGPKPIIEFRDLAHEQTGISKAKVRDLISRGERRYWTIEKQAHNRQIVKPIQFSSFQDPIGGKKLENCDNTPETIENKEFCVEDL